MYYDATIPLRDSSLQSPPALATLPGGTTARNVTPSKSSDKSPSLNSSTHVDDFSIPLKDGTPSSGTARPRSKASSKIASRQVTPYRLRLRSSSKSPTKPDDPLRSSPSRVTIRIPARTVAPITPPPRMRAPTPPSYHSSMGVARSAMRPPIFSPPASPSPSKREHPVTIKMPEQFSEELGVDDLDPDYAQWLDFNDSMDGDIDPFGFFATWSLVSGE